MIDGNKIRELRESKGVSATQFSKVVFISEAMVSYIENGIKKPSVETLKRIADVLECKIDDLLKTETA